METIDFTEASAFDIKISNLSDKKGWYSQEYTQAALMLRDIVTENIFKFRNQDIDFENSPEQNNIIAITGDRGSGKSTVMATIVAHLKNSTCEKGKYPISDLDELIRNKGSKNTKLAEKKFHILPPLDPSKLPEGETLLGFTVAFIYNDLIKMLGEPKYAGVDFTTVLKECEKTYEAIRIRTISIATGLEQNPDELEMLGKLANTSTLRQCLMELIAEYLQLKKCHNTWENESRHKIENTFLVIPIDDLDTNIQSGYSLAEEIRNFFFIPQVVIVMAVKLEQLTDVVQQHFLSAFSKMLKEKVLDVQPEEMATKYIQKLIPDQRRVHLHTLTPHALQSILVKTKALVSHNGAKGVPLVDYFFRLVWEKSGILLTKSDFGGHGIIPLNLRSLHQALELFEGMDSIALYNREKPKVKNQQEILKKNMARLETWILDSVSSNAVPRGMAIIVRKLAANPNDGLNGALVDLLVKYSTGKGDNQGYAPDGKPVHRGLFGHDKVTRDLVGLDTIPENISIGDVLYLLGMIERHNSGVGFMHFTAAVRFLYSLRLTEALFLTGHDNDKENENNSEEGFKNASTILGGLVYNPAIPLTPTGMEWSPNRDPISAKIQIPGPEQGTETRVCFLDGLEAPTRKGIPPQDADTAGESTQEDKNLDTISITDAVWLSHFIVQYGSSMLRKKRLFLYSGGPYTETRFFKERADFMGYISINWMAFVVNALSPELQVERLLAYGLDQYSDQLNWILGKGEELNEKGEEWKSAKNFIAEMNRWKKEYRVALPVYSVDVLNTLISRLNKFRFKNRQQDNKTQDGIAKFRDFFTLKAAIKDELVNSLKLTALQSEAISTSSRKSKKAPVLKDTEEKIIDALNNCPVYAQADGILKHYKADVRPQDNLKFDWIELKG